jgi:hypothetical protein
VKLRRCLAMARETERAEVVEVALTAAFGDRTDVVCVPERAAGGNGLHPVEAEARETISPACPFEGGVDGKGIGLAGGADAAVAREDLIAEVAGVGTKTPLVNTVIGAKSATAFGENLEVAPAAERKIIGAAREGMLFGTAAG